MPDTRSDIWAIVAPRCAFSCGTHAPVLDWAGKMAKAGKKRGTPTAARPMSGGTDDPLKNATELFERGDYARSRVLLREKAEDAELPEGVREQARDILESMRVERATIGVGLACIGLLVLVLIVTALTQP